MDDCGQGTASSVLAGLQWVLDNKEKYNIRIANLSIGTKDTEGKDPLIKAVNAAWDMGIVMTIAAGNNGPAKSSITSPGISKKVITVGSSDDNSSAFIWGDNLVNYSGRGPTVDCVIKPDIVAPGCDIVSCLTKTPNNANKPKNQKILDNNYVQMSGTSMSTPIVTGAIALLLQKHPKLTPNDVKLALKESSTDLHYPKNQQGWGLLNISNLLKINFKK